MYVLMRELVGCVVLCKRISTCASHFYIPAACKNIAVLCYLVYGHSKSAAHVLQKNKSTKTTKQSSIKSYNVHGEPSAMSSLAVLEQTCGTSQKRN